MTLPGQPSRESTRNLRSILRTVATRVGVYAALCLIVLFALVDFHTFSSTAPAPSNHLEDRASTTPAWPHFRGPTYDAHSTETDLADAWPTTGPPVLWTKEIGAGYSGIIAKGSRIFTQAQGLTEQKVLAMDADTGQTIWEQGNTWPYQPAGMFPGPRATPTWSNGKIYYASPNGEVGCLNAGDGHPIWSVNVLQKFKGRGITFGYACSPVVEEGMVILPVGGLSASVVALDAETGAVRWTSGSSPASYCSVLPISFQGRRQVVAFLQNTLEGFDLKTGRQLWQQEYAKGYDEHAATPLYQEPYLRTTQAYRAGSDLYELQPGTDKNAQDIPPVQIKRLRHDAQMSNDVAASVLVDGFVYGFDLRDQQTIRGHPSHGTFRCMNFMTGEVKWSSDQPGQASIIVADGKLLMLNDQGQLLMIRANPNRYEELAKAEVFPGETCWTAPALDRGRLFLRSPTRAACIFVGKPEKMTDRQRAQSTPLAAIPKTGPTDIRWLIGAERESPFEMPDFRELMAWYLYSLAALAAAGLLAGITNVALRISLGRWPRRPAAIIFWLALPLFGLIATPLANRQSTQFIFTWPLSLIAVHQISLAAISWKKQNQSLKADWLGLAGAALLILACVFYFKFTRQLNLAPAWHFLLMFPIAWPLAVPAARRLCRAGGLTGDFLWMVAVFTVYFWAAGSVMLLRTAFS